MGPHPAVAAIRLAVRRTLQDLLPTIPHTPAPAHHTRAPRRTPEPPTTVDGPGADGTEDGQDAPVVPGDGRAPLILAACSGGADSTALASALAFEAPRLGLRAGAVTVDHGLQSGSAARAREVVARFAELGLTPAEVVTVSVGREGGPEAAARTARYAALNRVAEEHGALAVLLGHTRDDQAETVLLGLARGSGTRSLAGMPAETHGPGDPAHGAGGEHPGRYRGERRPGDARATGLNGTPVGTTTPRLPGGPRYHRPFLTVDRGTTLRACAEQGLPVWDDPHNADPAYTRSRVRHEALPVLEKALGGGITEALARTAQLARDDADALDGWARQAETTATRPDGTLDIAALHDLPPAVRRRVLRRAAIAAGAPAGSLFARHIEETDRLITAWHGQRPLNLPGRVEARRQGGRLVLEQANR